MNFSEPIQVWDGDGIEPAGIRAARLAKEHAEWVFKENAIKRAFHIPPPKPGFEGVLAECPSCNRMVPLEEIQKRRSEVTQYVNEESNWSTECYECWESSELCWKEQMDEYHFSIRC
jgi:hypothetical protein